MPDEFQLKEHRLRAIAHVRDIVEGFSNEVVKRNEWDWENPVYDPRPVDLGHMGLADDQLPLVDMVANGLHKSWMEAMIKDGWQRGSAPSIDEKSKLHPHLVEWGLLPTPIQDTYLKSATLTLKLGDAAKCKVTQRASTGRHHTEVPRELHQLREVVAFQYHELWVRERMAASYSYGPNEDEQLKRHPYVLPWCMLDAQGRSKDISSAEVTLLNVLNSGCAIAPPLTKCMLLSYPDQPAPDLARQVEAFNTFIVDRLEKYFDIEIDALERHGDQFDCAIFVHFREDVSAPKKAKYKGTQLIKGKNVGPPQNIWVPSNPRHSIINSQSSFPGLSEEDLLLRVYCISRDPEEEEMLQIIKTSMGAFA